MTTEQVVGHARPFIKWAGGKGNLVGEIRALMPPVRGRHIEPFIGGGALFWALNHADAVISDVNSDLVNCYVQIRTNVECVISELRQLSYVRDLYYDVREMFNQRHRGTGAQRAAWFIYMNKTGFNGLCRYNSAGGFNVPFGSYVNPRICDADNLRACSAGLTHTDIRWSDFSAICHDAVPGDFVYLDPPYVPASDTADFTAYAPGKRWDASDDERCARAFFSLVRRGVDIIASNSDTPRSRALYAGARIVPVTRPGGINSNPSKRGRVGEILILPS